MKFHHFWPHPGKSLRFPVEKPANAPPAKILPRLMPAILCVNATAISWTLGFKGGVQHIEVDVIPKYTVICYREIINNNEIFINISTMKFFAKKSGIKVQKFQVKFSVFLPVLSSRNLHCWIFVLWMPKSVRRTC